jgi:hypothetical protein
MPAVPPLPPSLPRKPVRAFDRAVIAVHVWINDRVFVFTLRISVQAVRAFLGGRRGTRRGRRGWAPPPESQLAACVPTDPSTHAHCNTPIGTALCTFYVLL